MRSIPSAIAFLILATQCCLKADQFIGPSASTNRFILASNQVALISGIYPIFLYDTNGLNMGQATPELGASIVANNATNTVYMAECKQGLTALSGPLELVVSNSVAISYEIITNTTIVSAVIKPGSTNVISIPSGKSLRFLSFDISGYNPLIDNASLINGSSTIQGMRIFGGSEFDGPLTIRFVYPVGPPGQANLAYTLPYYIEDKAVVLPDQVALQAPTGNFEIQLQKSSDLVNWFPSVVLPASSDVKAFYRIQISK